MKVEIADEADLISSDPGTWSGYVSIQVVDELGDIVFVGHVSPELANDLGDMMNDPDVMRVLADIEEAATDG